MRLPVIFSIRPDKVFDRQGSITNSLVKFIRERIACFFGADVSVTTASAPPNGPCVDVTLTTLNPLFDEVLVERMIDRAGHHRSAVISEGAVGGSAPVSVVYRGLQANSEPYVLWHDGQDRYNSQLNLTKLKRIKIFASLQRKVPDLARYPLFALLDFLGTAKGVELVLSYGEDIDLDYYSSCPGCSAPQPAILHCNSGQPRIGFLTRHSSYYSACGACGLVFLNPAPREPDLWKLYDWYDKERVTPASDTDFEQAGLSKASYARLFEVTLERYGPLVPASGRIVDLGGGTGAFATMARHRFPRWKVEVQDFDCSEVAPFLAARGIDAKSVDFTRVPLERDAYSLITLFEVIEHLRVERLKTLWSALFGALRPGGLLVFSTPDFASPYARLHDFWAAFAPHHLTVLSRRVLEPLWQSAGYVTVDVTAESLLFRPDQGDFDYYRSHAGSLAERASAEVLRDASTDTATDAAFHSWRRRNARGGEMLVVLKRPAST